jgi:tRNA threonylcarbamoyladenosine biosynthesis protein TsaE
MVVIRTSSVVETQRLAAELARQAQPGDLVLLVGDLGTGKTAFAQGFGRGLGVTEPITSPTFTLHRRYQGRLTLHHLDVYRFEGLSDVADLGLSELLEGSAVTLIEWGDTIRPALPQDRLEVHLALGDGVDERHIELVTLGERWAGREPRLAQAAAGPEVVAAGSGVSGISAGEAARC